MSSIKVQSFTSEGTAHKVDPEKLTCSCPDYRIKRSGFETSDPRRLCKHLLLALVSSGELPEQLAQFEGTINRINNIGQRGFPVDFSEMLVINFDGEKVDVFLPASGGEWADVIDDSGRYGFNIYEERWAKDLAPDGHEAIATHIRTATGNKKAAREDLPPHEPKTPPPRKRPGCGMILLGLVLACIVFVLAAGAWHSYKIHFSPPPATATAKPSAAPAAPAKAAAKSKRCVVTRKIFYGVNLEAIEDAIALVAAKKPAQFDELVKAKLVADLPEGSIIYLTGEPPISYSPPGDARSWTLTTFTHPGETQPLWSFTEALDCK